MYIYIYINIFILTQGGQRLRQSHFNINVRAFQRGISDFATCAEAAIAQLIPHSSSSASWHSLRLAAPLQWKAALV